MRPIAILILAGLLATLVYSQRHTFFRQVVNELQEQMDVNSERARIGKIVLDPVAAASAMRNALAFLEADNLDSAAVHLGRAVELDAFDPTPRRYLAALRARQGRPGEALRTLEEAVALDSTDVWTWVQLGKLRSQLGEKLQARNAWERAVALDSTNVAARELLTISGNVTQVDMEFPPDTPDTFLGRSDGAP